MKNIAAMYGMMAAFSVNDDNPMFASEKKEPVMIQPKPPTGTKEYFFKEDGECFTVGYKDTDFVFKCYAINYKNAVRKFKRWQA